jgi:hypothetical protein
MRVHFCLTVLIMAGTVGSLPAAPMAPPTTEGSVVGLLAAGVVLIGIGRFRLRKR